jgi:hypothetical protein
MSPAAGSPAVDSGRNCAGVDQRGGGRPQGPQCDMGAVEVFTTKLVFRDGFEEGICYTGSLSKSTFLTRVRTAIDGATVCIPQFTGNYLGVDATACNTAACPGGATGCPITIAASPFTDGGDFGAGLFTATGTAGNVTVPFDSQFLDCVFTVSNITTSYSVDYLLLDEGNGGVYAAALNSFTPAATNLDVDSTNPTCDNLGPNVKDALANEASKAVVAALRPAIETATLDETVCPIQ